MAGLMYWIASDYTGVPNKVARKHISNVFGKCIPNQYQIIQLVFRTVNCAPLLYLTSNKTFHTQELKKLIFLILITICYEILILEC